MLDVLAIEVAESPRDISAFRVEVRADVATRRSEVSAGFNRIERRLDWLESRVENVETGMCAIADLDSRVTVLERGSNPKPAAIVMGGIGVYAVRLSKVSSTA